jgi:hypothetical protein
MNKGWKRKGFVFNMAIVFMPPCGQSTQWIFVIYAAAAQNVKFPAILSFAYCDGEYTLGALNFTLFGISIGIKLRVIHIGKK